MTLLGLVVAAGLVMGLLAFRVTSGSAGAAGAAGMANGSTAATKMIGGDPDAPHPSAADSAVALPPDATPLASDSESQNGEPGAGTDTPQMQGPGSGDPPMPVSQPDTASSEPSAPSAPSGDSTPQ